MARGDAGGHAKAVGFTYDPGDGSKPANGPPLQRGLPGVAPEEAPLPSERVLSGAVLADRRREALAKLRAVLGDRPEGFLPEEWRVVVGLLAPAGGGGTGTAGVAARLHRAALARECFPGLSAPAAIRALLEVAGRPHVAQVVNDFRALEGIDVLEQRSMLREALYQVIGLAGGVPDLVACDPSSGAKVAASVVAAVKVLMDLDGLKAAMGKGLVGGDDDGAGGGGSKSGPLAIADDPLATLRDKLAIIAADQASRAGQP